MTDLLPVLPDDLSGELDPVGYMTTVLHRAKSWLTEAQSIDDVRHTKAIAVGYESVIREKELAFDAQLAATEIVRRCERRIGELVKQGQEEGTIRPPSNVAHGRVERVLPDPASAVGVRDRSELIPMYRMAEATPEQFDQAISEARDEGNLSRANVVRKVKGETKPEPSRSEWHHKKRHFDSNRIVRETVLGLDGLASGLEYVNYDALDVEEKLQWIESVRKSLTIFHRFLKELSR